MNLYRTLRSLRDHERGIKPDAAWVRATRETLLMQVRNTMPTAEVAARHRLPFFVSLYRRVSDALRGPVLATLSIASVVLGGSIASVSAAERSLPGDTLYTVKLVTEQARLAFAGKPDKVKLKAEFTKRRVEELKAIVTAPGDASEKNVRAALAADGLKRDLDTLKQQLTDVQQESDGKTAADAAKAVDKNAMEVSKTLAETKDDVSPEVKERMVAAQVQAADVGIRALEVLITAREDGGDEAVSSEEIGASLAAHTEVTNEAVNATRALVGISDAASSTLSALPTNGTSSTLQLANAAANVLATVQQLAGEQKLGEAVGALKDATLKTLTAQKQAELQIVALNASSSTVVLPSGSASSSASSTNMGNASSTPSGVSQASSTNSGVTSTSTPP